MNTKCIEEASIKDISDSDPELNKDDVESDETSTDDDCIQVTDDMEDVADIKRNEALSKFETGNYDEAINLYTEALKLYPYYGLYYQERAHCHYKLKNSSAAIKDCNKSLKLNPNSSLAYDWRGLSYKLLGKYEQAFNDFISSLELDFDENIYREMIEIKSKAGEMKNHRRAYEDKILKRRLEKIDTTHEEIKSKKGNNQQIPDNSAIQVPNSTFSISHIVVDQDLVDELKDSDVNVALNEIKLGRATVEDYKSNPKVFQVLLKLKEFMEKT